MVRQIGEYEDECADARYHRHRQCRSATCHANSLPACLPLLRSPAGSGFFPWFVQCQVAISLPTPLVDESFQIIGTELQQLSDLYTLEVGLLSGSVLSEQRLGDP